MQRVRMQYQRHWRIRAAGVMIAALDPAFRAIDNDLRHGGSNAKLTSGVG
jgi:hypothetical protein